jgi:hypothetical protein
VLHLLACSIICVTALTTVSAVYYLANLPSASVCSYFVFNMFYPHFRFHLKQTWLILSFLHNVHEIRAGVEVLPVVSPSATNSKTDFDTTSCDRPPLYCVKFSFWFSFV